MSLPGLVRGCGAEARRQDGGEDEEGAEGAHRRRGEVVVVARARELLSSSLLRLLCRPSALGRGLRGRRTRLKEPPFSVGPGLIGLYLSRPALSRAARNLLLGSGFSQQKKNYAGWAIRARHQLPARAARVREYRRERAGDSRSSSSRPFFSPFHQLCLPCHSPCLSFHATSYLSPAGLRLPALPSSRACPSHTSSIQFNFQSKGASAESLFFPNEELGLAAVARPALPTLAARAPTCVMSSRLTTFL